MTRTMSEERFFGQVHRDLSLYMDCNIASMHGWGAGIHCQGCYLRYHWASAVWS